MTLWKPVAMLLLALLAPASHAGEELPTFSLVAKDGRIIPDRLEVPAGRKIKLLLTNEGPGPEEFESSELRVEKVLGAGARSFVVIHNLAPGTYRFFGEFHPETAECLIVAK